MRPDWFMDWSRQRCVVVASGPSAADVVLDILRGSVRVITTNDSWRLAPFADVLYACDAQWWQTGAGDWFGGMKVSREHHPGVRKVDLATGPDGRFSDGIEFERLGILGAGAGSGFQALNLAVQFGCRRIALVGFDARVDDGIHWHGAHGGGLDNPYEATAELWRVALDRIAPVLVARGIDVVNCSARSALTAFRKQGLVEWLDEPFAVAA